MSVDGHTAGGLSWKPLFLCAPGDRRRARLHALRLAQSLRWFGGSMAAADCAIAVRGDCDSGLRSEFERAGAEVWTLPVSEAGPDFVSVLSHPQLGGYDSVVLLDPATLVLRDPAPYLVGDCVWARAERFLPIAASGVERCLRSLPPRFASAGAAVLSGAQFHGAVVALPTRHLEVLRTRYSEAVQGIDLALFLPDGQFGDLSSHPAVASLSGRARQHLRAALPHSLLLSLSLSASELEVGKLPDKMNAPGYYFLRRRVLSLDPVICRYLPEPEDRPPGGPVQHYYPEFDCPAHHAIAGFNERLLRDERERRATPRGGRPSRSGFASGAERARRRPPLPAANAEELKIVVAATPKSGNNWLSELLSQAYDVPIIHCPNDPEELLRLDDRRFVLPQHYLPTPEILQWAEDRGVYFVTLARHPADVFLSLYHFINDLEAAGLEKQTTSRPRYRKLIGRSLEDPEVVDFMANDFSEIENTLFWVLSGAALLVRFEDLKAAPEETLVKLTRRICPVSPERVAQAIEASSMERMRRKSPLRQVLVRKGVAGEGLRTLPPKHLEILRRRYGPDMRLVGYDL